MWRGVAALLVLLLAIGCTAVGAVSGPARAAGPKPDPPSFKTEVFVVRAGHEYFFTLPSVQSGGVIEGYFIVSGGNNDVGFRVRGPEGAYLVDVGRVRNRFDFHYDIEKTGPYILSFDNGFSWFTDKHVTLVWRAYWYR